MTRSPQTSFRVGSEVWALPPETRIRPWAARYGRSRSAQIVEDLDTLQALVTAAGRGLGGRFTLAEAILLVNVLNGQYVPQLLDTSPAWLVHRVEDALLGPQNARHPVDGPALLDKLRDLGPMETYTLQHWARLWWAQPDQDADLPWLHNLFRIT